MFTPGCVATATKQTVSLSVMLYGHSPEECVDSGITSITIGLVLYVSGCVHKLPPIVG